ncbi:hypothetical protein F4808DRAFT_472224 [Astrocystis sublimbata]|nr:hypothetical protein F4808DRAFT_472224 [Astrocystis sublimbata]
MAKDFLLGSLQHFSKNPYVLVQHADLLLQQGDFKGVTLLQGDPIYDLEKKSPESKELKLLRVNWELIQLSAKLRTLGVIDNASTLFDEVSRVLKGLGDRRMAIGSIEIKILGLAMQLRSSSALEAEWRKRDWGILDRLEDVFKRLHAALLDEGRIWDLHDLLTLTPMANNILYYIFGTNVVSSLKHLISQWSTPSHDDPPTNLALLSILAHIALEVNNIRLEYRVDLLKLGNPIAMAVLKHDPESMRTRPYLHFLLANSQFAELGSHNAVSSLMKRLKLSRGVSFHPSPSSLPIYLPKEMETPNWALADTPLEAKRSASLALQTARSCGDIKSEVLSLQELIRLAEHPHKEFETLCQLQLSSGDIFGYGQSLASKYLITKSPQDKEKLKFELTDVLSKVHFAHPGDIRWRWALAMLIYKLEGRSLEAIRYLLQRDFADCQNIDGKILEQIHSKMSEISDWAHRQAAQAAEAKDTQRAEPASEAGSNHSYTSTAHKVHISGSPMSDVTIRPSIRPQVNTDPNEQHVGEVQDDNDDNYSESKDEATDEAASGEHLETSDSESSDTDNFRKRTGPEATHRHVNHIQRDYMDRSIRDQDIERQMYKRKIDDLEKTLEEIREHRAAEHQQAMMAQQEANRARDAHAQQTATLELERRAREKAELERDEHKNHLLKFKESTNEQIASLLASKETEHEAMLRATSENMAKMLDTKDTERKAMIQAVKDMAYEQERKAEAVRTRALEEQEKRTADSIRLEEERRANAVLQERKQHEQWMLAKTAQADNEARVSLLVAQKLVEAAQTAERIGLRSQEDNEQEEKLQIERQAMRRKLVINVTLLTSAGDQGTRGRLKAEAELRAAQDHTQKSQRDDPYDDVAESAANASLASTANPRFVHFEDALGRKFVFPLETCSTWAGMEDLIKQAFQEIEGIGPHVEAGHYDLVLNGEIILPLAWEFSVMPGSRVTMHMWPNAAPDLSFAGFRPGPASSISNAEHSIRNGHESNSDEGSILDAASSPGTHLPDHGVPPMVPEVPLSQAERSVSPGWRG